MAIPAFFGLANGSTANPDWGELLSAGAVAKIVVMDMSDIGTGTGIAGTCTQSISSMIDCLHRNGSLVLGYVDTDFGCRTDFFTAGPASNAGVGNWIPAFNVDGIFFDNVTSDDPNHRGCFNAATYRSQFNQFHTQNPANHLSPDYCNGRACVMTNSSQYPINDIIAGSANALDNADFSTTYERMTSGTQFDHHCPGNNDHQGYLPQFDNATQGDTTGFCPSTSFFPGNCSGTAMTPDGWYFSTDLGPRTAQVLRQDPSQQPLPALSDVISISQQRHAGFLYVSDFVCSASYGHLTSFYETLKAALGVTLTVDRTSLSTGTGKVTSAASGISCDESASEQCTNLIPKQTVVVLAAQPDPGSNFAGIFAADGAQLCSSSPCTLPALTAATTVKAKFTTGNPPPDFTLTVNKTGPATDTVVSTDGKISCGTGAGCTATYAPGSQVSLSVLADGAPGATFTGWSGDCSGTGSCDLTMGANHTVTANFSFSATLQVAVTGNGSVTSTDGRINCGATCAATYTSPTQVTLNPVVGDGSTVFSGWSGACTGTGACVISLNGNTQVTATFTSTTTLTLQFQSVNGGTGKVTVSPGGAFCTGTCQFSVLSGSVLTLNASPTNGITSGSMTGGGCNATNPCTVTVASPTTVIVKFTRVNPTL